MYTECQEKNVPISINAYNGVLSMVSMLREGEDKAKTLVADIYKTMATNGITPNIHTFNAALNVASTFRNRRVTLDFTRNIFADIAQFKLKPTLTTYLFVLRILNGFGNYAMHIFISRVDPTFTSLFNETDDAAYMTFIKILKSLKEETLTIQNARDLNFFNVAMEMAFKQFCDRKAGEMINELLLSGENYKFIGDQYRVSILR